MTYSECIEKMRDGRAYIFTNPNLKGYFFKAPFPALEAYTKLDGAESAITYYDKENHKPSMPVLMLYDFDDDEAEWTCEVAFRHPLQM